jgi:3',5'-cyclic AMP phosphodiesterase CpdA
MRIQRIAAATAATALTISLVGCSEAQDAADKAKAKASEAAASAADAASQKAKDAASGVADKAKAKASEMAGSTFEDVLAKLSPEQQEKLKGLEAVALGTEGELQEDPDSLTAAEYFAARQAAVESGDLTDLKAVAAKRGLRNAKRYISRGKAPANFVVNVVSSDAGTVNVCVGPKGKNPRTLTITEGKVTLNAKGTHTC